MPGFDELYRELKADFQTLAAPLMDFGEQQIRKHDAFLPFGATLTSGGEVALQAAMPGRDPATSEEVLPILCQGLVAAAGNPAVSAVAAAEWVQIAHEGEPLQPAIKVHVHHRRGLAVAFYVPATKRLLRGWSFGDTIARPADTLVPAWQSTV